MGLFYSISDDFIWFNCSSGKPYFALVSSIVMLKAAVTFSIRQACFMQGWGSSIFSQRSLFRI